MTRVLSAGSSGDGTACRRYDDLVDTSPLPDGLLAGYRSFRAERYPAEAERYRRLSVEGQAPRALVVACSDSRSGPEIVFDAAPGELFVVRNVAALVPAYAPDGRSHSTSAALEFAVLALGVPAVLVMGHARCGGVRAALDPASPLTSTDFVGTWVEGLRGLEALLAPGEAADAALRRTRLERLAVEQSLANLRTFPWVREREGAGALTLRGAWFDIATGELHALGASGWLRVDGGA